MRSPDRITEGAQIVREYERSPISSSVYSSNLTGRADNFTRTSDVLREGVNTSQNKFTYPHLTYSNYDPYSKISQNEDNLLKRTERYISDRLSSNYPDKKPVDPSNVQKTTSSVQFTTSTSIPNPDDRPIRPTADPIVTFNPTSLAPKTDRSPRRSLDEVPVFQSFHNPKESKREKQKSPKHSKNYNSTKVTKVDINGNEKSYLRKRSTLKYDPMKASKDQDSSVNDSISNAGINLKEIKARTDSGLRAAVSPKTRADFRRQGTSNSQILKEKNPTSTVPVITQDLSVATQSKYKSVTKIPRIAGAQNLSLNQGKKFV